LNNNFLSDSDATNQELNNQIFHKKKIKVKKTTIANNRVIKQLNYIPKAGHFVLFLSLGLCLAAILLTDKKKILLMDIICFAGVTELMQMFIEGRLPFT